MFDLYRKLSNGDLAILLGQYGKAEVWDFPVKTSLSVNTCKVVSNCHQQQGDWVLFKGKSLHVYSLPQFKIDY